MNLIDDLLTMTHFSLITPYLSLQIAQASLAVHGLQALHIRTCKIVANHWGYHVRITSAIMKVSAHSLVRLILPYTAFLGKPISYNAKDLWSV